MYITVYYKYIHFKWNLNADNKQPMYNKEPIRLTCNHAGKTAICKKTRNTLREGAWIFLVITIKI